jgi:Pro-kumamolisin, activation domain/Bacterial Ig-like domain (group 3)
MHSRGHALVASAVALTLLVSCQQQTQPSAQKTAGAVARVTEPIDSKKLVTLSGHVIPALAGATDLGRVAKTSQLNHLIMVLKPTAEQEHSLQQLVDQQVDKNHPNFHKWLQPAEFGNRFGLAQADLDKLKAWLEGEGFAVEQIAPGKRFIQFSGTVGQVESSFHTEMHQYSVNGKPHIANSTEISVPKALGPVIAGVPTLHDFFKKSNLVNKRTLLQETPAQLGPVTEKTYLALPGPDFVLPDYTNGTTHFVGAGDFATIYNTTPLINAGFDGTGVSIGIIGRTQIDLADVQTYRYMFGLKANDPTVVVAGEDPGIVGGDDGESYLDVEVSGGAAPGASVKFIIARATLTVDGVDLAAMYAVQNNLTDIISESYGQCEANFSAAGAAFYNNLWGQAAAQGQSVFVSSGDNGPAACENSNNNFETTGYAVSMLASSPYNVAVGGTIFAEGTGVGTSWSTPATVAPPFSSALGYIVETPWNESKPSGATGAAGLWSGSGGISAWFLTPSWQRGFGVPLTDPAYPNFSLSSPASPFVPGPHRYLPDVSLAAAADHDGTLYCGEGICQLSATGSLINAGIVGGTSVAAPSMAGVQALINSRNGGRQGQPGYVYYALADAQHTAGLNCAANAGSSIDPNCAFHDVTTGNTLICETNACSKTTTPPSLIGWTAAPGYDFATGLGSPNVTNLANLWSTVTFNSSTTTLSLSNTSGINHGDSVTLSGTVAAGSGSAIPTGTVAFFAGNGGLANPVDATGSLPVSVATLDANGNYSLAVTELPAGTYAVTARYAGDGTFASSVSAPVSVSAAPEGSTVTIQPNAFNQTTCVETAQTTFTYGSYLWTDVTVTGVSGSGVPTGSVAITDNGATYVTTSLNPTGVGHVLSGAIPTTSCVFGFSFQDAAPLTGGTHVLGATYSGDSNFGPLAATPVTVTITPATVTGALRSSATNISASGDPVHFTLTLTALNGAGPGTLPPTGPVTLTDTTTSTVIGTGTLSASGAGAIATFDTNAIQAAGAHSLTASWVGDANYAGGTTAAVTVTVQAGTSSSVAVTSNLNPATLGGRPTWTATMTPTTVTAGTVNFYDGSTFLGSGTVGAAHTATFRPAATVNLPAGIHTITAYYAGNATFNASVSPGFSQTFNPAATTVTVTAQAAGTFGTNNNTYYLAATLGTLVTNPSTGVVVTPPSGTVQFFDGQTSLGTTALATVTQSLGGFGLFTGSVTATLGAGSHSITAVLTDPNYTAPTSTAYPINIAKGTPVITFPPLGDRVFGSAPFTVSATGTASTPVTFSSNTPAVCTVSGTTVTLVSAGICTIEADQAGDANFNAAAPVTRSFAVTQASQTITFPAIASFTWLGGSATLAATASSGLPVTYSLVSGPCSISGSTVTATAAGSCTIAADQAGDGTFPAAPEVTQTVTVTKADQIITFAALTDKALGSAPFTVSATGGGSTSPVTFSSTTTAVCTVNDTTVTLVSAGTCTIEADQAGDDNYNAATPVTQSFSVGKAAQSITFPAIASFSWSGGSATLAATASSGLPVTYSVVSGPCSISGNTLTATAAGSCTIAADQAGDANFNAALEVTQPVTVNKADQTITFAALADKVLGSAPFTVSAAGGGSTSPVTFSSTTAAVCTVSGSTVTLVSAGTCTIEADQAGDANYNAAAPVSRSFAVGKASQTITFPAIASFGWSGGSATLAATASSGLAVTYSLVSGPCSISGSTVTATAAGSCTIAADQAGNANFTAALQATQTVTVTKAGQTITFAALTDKVLGSAPFTVSATGGASTSAVTFSSLTAAVCTVSGSTVTLVSSGTCTIEADQAGDANYNAAAPVSRSFSVGSASQTITFPAIASFSWSGGSATLAATASSGLPVTYSVTSGPCAVSGSTLTATAAGSCIVAADQAGNGTFTAAAEVTGTVTVTQAGQVITFGALSDAVFGSAPFTVSATGGASASPVTFSSLTAAVCTVSGSTVTLVSAGTCTIEADQAGDANFSAAAPVARSFAVAKASQTITFPAIASFGFNSGSATLAATSSSGLAVTYTVVSGPCALSGSVLSASAAGTCVVAADQAGNGNVAAAAQATQSVTVTDDGSGGGGGSGGCTSTGPADFAEFFAAMGVVAFWRRRRQVTSA